MQRTALILAYFFILPVIIGTIGTVNCFSQSAGSSGPADPIAIGSVGQYPFVHYTPKDGLISNNIRNIYQDSKGRLYFTSINGLSVYDGTRFINYNTKNGLDYDIVNCVMEMGEDSVWIVTNISKIQCIVKGKLKALTLNDPPPLIDNLIRDENGSLYAASENGLYLFQNNRFIKLPFTDLKGRDISRYIGQIAPAGKLLMIMRDNSLLVSEEKNILYLYDTEAKRIIAQTQKEKIFHLAKAPDGRIWVSTDKKILAVDTNELKKGKIVFQKLPILYDKVENSGINFISFDQNGNFWLTDKVFVLKKLSPDGNIISFTIASGLSTMDVSNVFQDKEGTTWIATHSG